MPSGRLRLVGRDRELMLLTDAYRAASTGRPGTVIVSGEAGIGKTRLVEELTEHVATTGGLAASGFCSPVSGIRLPYGPLVDLVASLLRQIPDLSRLVPEEAWLAVAPLSGVRVRPCELPDPQLASTRLFVGFVELLAASSMRQPALFVLEDVQWADPASVDLLTFAARRLHHERILLVLTSRPTSAAPPGPVRSALGELRRLR